MLEEIELFIYDKYIKKIIVEENGVKMISKVDLDGLGLTAEEQKFITNIINKQNIQVIEDRIKKSDRSSLVRDNNYGDIKSNGLEVMDEPTMSEVEYSLTNDKMYKNYDELDKYLETRFIPTYILLKKKKNQNGEIEYYPSVRLGHIMALKLSEAELKHVMEYLKAKSIKVAGSASTLDGEFENYDYVTTYKSGALPESIASDETLRKLALYKQTKDIKLRDEIITDNMRLVGYVVHKYASSTNINRHELESYGNEALIMAVENFDVDKGYHFSTFAIAYIRGYILNGIQKEILGKKGNIYYDFVKCKTGVERQNGVSIEEDPYLIDNILDLLVKSGKIKNDEKSKQAAKRKITALCLGNQSLDDEETVEELSSNGKLTDTQDYAEIALDNISKEALRDALKILTPRECEIIKLRYGFYDNEPKTLSEIGKIYDISTERVKQVETKALKRLRQSDIMGRLTEEYEDVVSSNKRIR